MEYRILISSNLAIGGQLDFKLSDLLIVFATTFNKINEVKLEPFSKARCAEEIASSKGNLIIFCENNYIDELIIDNIQVLGANKHMVDELAVVFEKDNSLTAFFPIDLDWQSLLKKVLDERKDNSLKYCKFHLFGKTCDSVAMELSKLKQENDSLNFNVLGECLLTDIYASYKGENNLIDDEQAKIASLFRNNLYSENDLGLTQIVFELLRIRNLKISIKEGITGGKVLAKLHENSEFKNVLNIGQVASMNELEPEKIYNEAYELLRKTNGDVVMVTGGGFDEKGLNCLLAIGDKNSINVYKNRFNASKTDSLNMATNCALFHLVKKLRQNNFAF